MVDIERPRDGGAAINCSQMASRHFSISAALVGAAGLCSSGVAACFAEASAVRISAVFGAGGVGGETCTAAGRGALGIGGAGTSDSGAAGIPCSTFFGFGAAMNE